MQAFDGLGMHLGSLARLSKAKTRSISPENPTGEKGKGGLATEGTGAASARELGPGWKISPSVLIEPGEGRVLADIEGSGAIQSMWLSGHTVRDGRKTRLYVLRMYWDDQRVPSVECPLCDFFASGWGQFWQINSLPVAVNPNSGYNSYWPMPFRNRCRITLENRDHEPMVQYYQINYTLAELPADLAYFHAQFRRTNPLPYKQPYTIVSDVEGGGQYVGTSLAWGANSQGWWGEGEIKFYIDGDEHPTICGTGTEDYFGGAYGWNLQGKYGAYSGPFMGMVQVGRAENALPPQERFCMYRWHIPDPIRFKADLRVTIQALGWQKGGKYRPLQDDISSVAFWYQTLPTRPFPALPDHEGLRIA